MATRYDPLLDCDVCFEADDYRRSKHGAPVLVRFTDTMHYEDGTSAPYTDMARWCPCCIATLSAHPDMTVTIVSSEA